MKRSRSSSHRARQNAAVFGDFISLAWEAQAVIGLRLMKLAAGGARATREAELMVREKALALTEFQIEAMHRLATGRGQSVPAKVISGYRQKVRHNLRRLSR